MFCTKCGKNNEDKYNFCIECGAPLSKPQVAAQPASSPAEPVASPEDTLDVFATVPKDNDASLGNDNSTTILGDSTKIILTRQDGEKFKIENFPVVVGKGSAADLIIAGDESISRKHFCIHEHEDGSFILEDLVATNKTYLNGDVLEAEELVSINNNDIIKAGKTELTILIVD